MSGRVVYAMKVTKKMTMAQYDAYTKAELPEKIPVWRSRDRRRQLGDSIYDFASRSKTPRLSVHNINNAATDLSGKYALLSTHFYYFGNNAIPLARSLKDIAQNRQGHRRKLNDPYVENFITRIESLGHKSGTLIGEPLCDLAAQKSARGWCAAGRAEDDDVDFEDLGGVC